MFLLVAASQLLLLSLKLMHDTGISGRTTLLSYSMWQNIYGTENTCKQNC